MKTQTKIAVCGMMMGLAIASRAGAQAKLPDNFSVTPPSIPDKTFNLKDFGAVGDGTTLNTDAIKKAMAAVDAAGGGTLEVPAGTYLTGPFQFVSNLNFHLAEGSKIVMSDDRKNYKLSEGGYEICITAENQHDILLSGSGTIDGNGKSWWDEFSNYRKATKGPAKPKDPWNGKPEEDGAGDKQTEAAKPKEDSKAVATTTTVPVEPPHRPYLIRFQSCQRVKVTGVTLINSPMLTLIPRMCEDVIIDGVTIKAPANSPNTDGIDPDGFNFHILNCNIDVGDDNIALKPHPAQNGRAGCENFLIEKMTFGHGHGMSIGGGSQGGVRNMLVRDCTFQDTDFGVRLKSGRGRGGVGENLTYENLTMKGVKTSIMIVSYYPDIPKELANDPAKPVNERTPFWKNVLIRNVTSTDGNVGCRILGLAEARIDNIVLDHVNITAKNRAVQIIRADNVKFVDSKVVSTGTAKNEIIDSKVEGLE